MIAHTSFRVSAKEDWYIDSGCSRHITGNKNLLTGLHPHATSYVTFGDGVKGEIKGIGKLDFLGVRSKDNFYMWCSQETGYSSNCTLAKEEEVKIWHQRLCHLHLKGMKRIIFVEAVRGIPNLKIDEGKICGECPIGKQTRMSHQKLRHDTTTKVLELLHVDLMGPMQVESLGGKKYAYVVLDDFSKYT
jgi:hypothetical protein